MRFTSLLVLTGETYQRAVGKDSSSIVSLTDQLPIVSRCCTSVSPCGSMCHVVQCLPMYLSCCKTPCIFDSSNSFSYNSFSFSFSPTLSCVRSSFCSATVPPIFTIFGVHLFHRTFLPNTFSLPGSGLSGPRIASQTPRPLGSRLPAVRLPAQAA